MHACLQLLSRSISRRYGLAPASVKLVDDEIVLNVSEKFVSYDAKNKVHKMLAPYSAKENHHILATLIDIFANAHVYVVVSPNAYNQVGALAPTFNEESKIFGVSKCHQKTKAFLVFFLLFAFYFFIFGL